MNLTIYVDELFFLNLIIDYLIIASTAMLLSLECKKARLLLASVFGALYSTLIFFPTLIILKVIILKLIASAVIVIISFGFKSFYRVIKITTIYYIINFLYGGGMYAFYRFTNLGAKMNYSNGEYYIDMPLWLIILLAVFFYFLVKIVGNIVSGKKIESLIAEIKIDILGKSIVTKALIDTGNALYDPISSIPVALLQKSEFNSVLNKQEINALANPDSIDFYNTVKKYKARLIPFYDATGKSNTIIAIKANGVTDITNNKALGQMLIGIVEHKLSPDMQYSALLHSKFYN